MSASRAVTNDSASVEPSDLDTHGLVVEAQRSRWATYEDYLDSSVWKAKRKIALERARNRCQFCNSNQGLTVHHRVYPDFWGNENPDDLTVLCFHCHNIFERSNNPHSRRSRHRHKKHKHGKQGKHKASPVVARNEPITVAHLEPHPDRSIADAKHEEVARDKTKLKERQADIRARWEKLRREAGKRFEGCRNSCERIARRNGNA